MYIRLAWFYFILSAAVSLADEVYPAIGHTVPERLFLQQVSYESALIKWRGDAEYLWYGSSEKNMHTKVTAITDVDHRIAYLRDLEPDTEYFYAFAADASKAFSFRTAPLPGETPSDGNIHIWLVGDSGTETEQVRGHFTNKGGAPKVRDAFYKYNKLKAANERLDLMLLLGDNAYLEGTDAQWQGAFFAIYPELTSTTSVWPTIGNHEMGVGPPLNICPYRKLPACEDGPVMIRVGGGSKSSDPKSYDSDGNGPDDSGLPYLNIFTLPTQGEVGGIPSGTEQYYSFDYGNLHVISLDSQLSNRDASKRSKMRDWLIKDLRANNLVWTIVIFHHPPYTKGENHDSDHELNEIHMRETFAPIFENYGVDVVYSGHAHSYERSWYLRQHYGLSDTYDSHSHAALDKHGKEAFGQGKRAYVRNQDMNKRRTIYTVAGSGGKADSLNPCPSGKTMGCTMPDWLEHPAHRTFDQQLPDYRKHGIARKGSVVLDVKKSSLRSRFIDDDGNVLDEFTIKLQ